MTSQPRRSGVRRSAPKSAVTQGQGRVGATSRRFGIGGSPARERRRDRTRATIRRPGRASLAGRQVEGESRVVDRQPGSIADASAAPATERPSVSVRSVQVAPSGDVQTPSPVATQRTSGRRPAGDSADRRAIGRRGPARPRATSGRRRRRRARRLAAADGQRVGRTVEDPLGRAVAADLQDAVVVGDQRRAVGVERQRARPLGQPRDDREGVAVVAAPSLSSRRRERGPRAGTAGPPSPRPRPPPAAATSRRSRPSSPAGRQPASSPRKTPDEVAIQTPARASLASARGHDPGVGLRPRRAPPVAEPFVLQRVLGLRRAVVVGEPGGAEHLVGVWRAERRRRRRRVVARANPAQRRERPAPRRRRSATSPPPSAKSSPRPAPRARDASRRVGRSLTSRPRCRGDARRAGGQRRDERDAAARGGARSAR